MNKAEFTKYIVEDFERSLEAADAVIPIFSESLGNTLSKGHSVELEILEEFKLCSISLRDLYLRLSKELTNQKIL